MEMTEEKMLVLDSPLAGKKYHGRQTWFAVWKPVDVGIVLMTRCLVLFPEMS